MDGQPHLPGCERAVVPIAKLRDYVLSSDHPQGRHKARVFAAALGLTAGDAAWLCEQMLAEIRVAGAVRRRAGQWGVLYEAVLWLSGRDDTRAAVRTAWLISHHGAAPRLVTAYIDTRDHCGGDADEGAG